MAENEAKIGLGNDELIKRIRSRYRYADEKWDRIRKDGQKNMRYVSGDPWDEEDKRAREGRPTVCADELNQYVNQVVNTARQNPRGIKVDPAGNDATEKLAEYRENRIRAIEYGCNAAQVYVNGLQAAVERNLGYWKVSRAYVSDDSDEQEILILPVQNPDSVLIDPDFKELDASDIGWAFELDRMSLDEFKEAYPDAEQKSFTTKDFDDDAKYWYDEKSILVASYWEVKKTSKVVGKKNRVTQSRTIHQYVTNGIEILKKTEQPGPYIPIVPVLSKELWIDNGSGSERFLLSLVTLARDPQKALAYVMSAMLENVGQLPKTSFIGAVGQFETDSDAWSTINNVFHPFLQYDTVIDASTGQPLPPPTRTPTSPDFQSYSIGADICRRAIQAAMGISPLPTAAQRQNEKSGTALSKIQSEQSIGSYHLVDSYDRAIKLTGRIINNWLTETDLGETTRPVRLADGKHKLVKINTDEPVTEGEHVYHYPIADDKGRYQVTISSGPSHESQREEGSEFVDTLLQNLKNLPLQPQQMTQILAIGIRLKQLGPLGDQMADIIAPQNQNQQQQLAQMQAQGQQMQQQIQEMQVALQKLLLEKQGKVIDNQFKATEGDKDRALKLAIAEVETKAQAQSERTETFNEVQSQFHDQAHDVAMQANQQQHEQAMGQQQAQNQQQLAAQQGQQSLQQQQLAQQQPQGEPNA